MFAVAVGARRVSAPVQNENRRAVAQGAIAVPASGVNAHLNRRRAILQGIEGGFAALDQAGINPELVSESGIKAMAQAGLAGADFRVSDGTLQAFAEVSRPDSRIPREVSVDICEIRNDGGCQ